jgi:hypothetical protein
MDAALASIFSDRAGALAAGVEAALLAQDAPHYRGAPQDGRRARVRGLPPRRDPARAVRAGGASAADRDRAGGDTDVIVRRLALVTGIVGRGKDELARAFLEHKQRAEARAAELAERLDRLFAGTDSGTRLPRPPSTLRTLEYLARSRCGFAALRVRLRRDLAPTRAST